MNSLMNTFGEYECFGEYEYYGEYEVVCSRGRSRQENGGVSKEEGLQERMV